MLILPIQIRYWIAPLTVGLLTIVGYLLEPWSSQWFAFTRTAIEHEQFFRFVTGHLLHTNFAHLVLNLAGLALLWGLHGEYYRPKHFVSVFLGCSVLTAIAIYVVSPHIGSYVGLSGVLHGLFVWGAVGDIHRGDKTGWLLLAGLIIKLGYEQTVGDSSQIAALIDASVAVDAHLWGALSGLALALLWLGLRLTWREPQS